MYTKTGMGVAAVTAASGTLIAGSLATVAVILAGGALVVLAVSWRRRRRDRLAAS